MAGIQPTSLAAGLYDVDLRLRNAASADLIIREQIEIRPAIA